MVSKARGLRLQLRGPSSGTTYHVGGLDERGIPLRSLAIYRARGRSYRLTSCLGGRVAGGASLASRVSRDFGSWRFPFPVGSLLITGLFRRLQWAGYRFCDVPRELALRGYLSRKAGFGALRCIRLWLCWAWLFSQRQGPGIRRDHRVSQLFTNSPIPQRPRASRCVRTQRGRLGPVACVSLGCIEGLFDPQCAHPVSLSAPFQVFVDVSTTLWELLGPHS